MTHDTDHPQAEVPVTETPAPAPGVTEPDVATAQADVPHTDSPQPTAPPAEAPAAQAPATDAPRVEIPKASAPPRVEVPVAAKSHDVTLWLLNALERSLKWVARSLTHPKVRLVVVGAILIIIGVWFINHSVWTFPLVIIGIVMIIVAWVGSRLEGRFGIEWNERGAGFEMQARFKSRAHALPAPAASTTANSTAPRTSVRTTHYSADGADETVIEGEAHTIEIDVDELRALVEAAERGTASASTNGSYVSWQGSGSGRDGAGG